MDLRLTFLLLTLDPSVATNLHILTSSSLQDRSTYQTVAIPPSRDVRTAKAVRGVLQGPGYSMPTLMTIEHDVPVRYDAA